ncbi:MAG: hypothetical protein KF773_29200 [Deltaproteobacteria bacterium]|nr:hypothetical protein [Deltaproteobacteria bacterium]
MRDRGLAALGLGLLAGCFAPNPPLGAPCSTQGDCPSGQQCDLVTNTCTLPTEVRAWRDDEAADFAAGTYLDEVTVERQGFLGPAAYFTGGWRLTGYPLNAFADASTATFEEIVANTASGTTVAYAARLDYGTGIPPGLGFTTGDNITIAIEGEIFLDAAGSWRFSLVANERGFFEIAAPGSREFQRVVADAFTGTIGTYEAAAPGWYRIRGAFVDDMLAMTYDLRVDSPSVPGNGFRSIQSDKLRAKVGDVPGFAVEGYDEGFALGFVGAVIAPGSLADQAFVTDPFGMPVGTGSFTLRWVGQVLIDVEGAYAFRIDSVQGHRAWIDGVNVADKMGSTAQVTVTEPAMLTPGWHDLVVELNKSGGAMGASLKLTVESGPAMVGESFGNDRVRPVRGRNARVASAFSRSVLDIPDGMSATRTVSLDLPAAFAPRRIDAMVEVSHPLLPTVEIVLDPPVGANITVAALGSLTGSGDFARRVVPPVGTAGATWSAIVGDAAADTIVGAITGVFVSILGDGGVAPFEPKYRYESAVRDLGDVAALGPMTWALRQAKGPEAAVARVRTCDEAAGCAAEAWVDVALGAVPAVPVRRFAQYQLEVTTNGDVPSAVDFVELAYSAYVGR